MEVDEAAVTAVSDVPEPTVDSGIQAAVNMDVETLNPDDTSKADGDANSKRVREEGAGTEEGGNGDVSKKPKVEEKSAEEQRLEKGQAVGSEVEEQKAGRVTVSLGPKNFVSSAEMYDYFVKFLHCWTPNVNVNKFEHMVLLDLLKKGHMEPDKKIGGGVHAFQVQNHPEFKSKCFFLIRDDESVDDFSFRKCVDHILPLPTEMMRKPNGGGGRASGRGGGRRRGRGRWRN